MKNNDVVKKVLFTNLLILILYIGLSFLNIFAEIGSTPILIPNIISLFLSILFVIYLKDHIAYKKQRIPLIILGVFMILFMVFQSFKYGPFNKIETVSRYLWYLYYLPTLFIPYFLFFSTLNYISNKKMRITIFIVTLIITLILFLFVISNDYHQLAFQFNDDFLNWGSDYKRGIIYYLIVIWSSLLLLASFIILYVITRIVVGKRYSWLSLIPLFLGLIWLFLGIFNIDKKITISGIEVLNEFPDTFCFIVAGYVLSLIKLGLITSNNNYDKYFKEMSQPAFILDKNNNIVYKSQGSYVLKKENIPLDNERIFVDNHIINSVPIHGGKAIYVQDVTEINSVKEELKDVKERLKEEERLAELIIKSKEEELSTKEKSAIYDMIAIETINESNTIKELVAETEKDLSLFDKNMPIVLLYSVYIKRLANFRLLIKENNVIHIQELFLALQETLNYLSKLNIKTDLVSRSDDYLYEGDYLLEIYKLFFEIIRNNILNIKNIFITFIDDEHSLLKVVIEGIKIKIADTCINNHLLLVNKEDDIYYLEFLKKEEK